VEEDRVVEEIQKGYFFGEKLYRPTKVIVSKNPCQK
jgi:molecular chaperone GrpE (heat shock protein)